MLKLRRCRTCGAPLITLWWIMGWPWTKRVRTFKDAEDCIHLLPAKLFEENHETD